MRIVRLAASAVAICGAVVGTPVSAATVTPDVLIIESDQNRGNGAAPGDVVAPADFGNITGLTAGIAGRIASAVDTFTFTYDTSFNLDFVNLLNENGVDIDNCEGFDGSDCSIGSSNNEDGRVAVFSLDNGVDPILSIEYTSTIAPGTSIFSNVGAGSYTFSIDGTSGRAGSAYDIAISPVPIPAGIPLLLSALGAAALIKRGKRQ